MRLVQLLMLTVFVLVANAPKSLWAAEQKTPRSGGQKVTLMLGGKFCDSYPDEVQSALKQVPGVKAVDLKSMKGHAMVETEAGKVKPEQLASAINKVKGEGWHCTAEVMK